MKMTNFIVQKAQPLSLPVDIKNGIGMVKDIVSSGPAVIWPDGDEIYYLNDERYDKKTYDKLVKLKIFW